MHGNSGGGEDALKLLLRRDERVSAEHTEQIIQCLYHCSLPCDDGKSSLDPGGAEIYMDKERERCLCGACFRTHGQILGKNCRKVFF